MLCLSYYDEISVLINDTETNEIDTDGHTRSLHDARPICIRYTEAKRSSVNNTFDLGDGSISPLFTPVINTYRQICDFGGPIPLVPLGDSVSQTGRAHV